MLKKIKKLQFSLSDFLQMKKREKWYKCFKIDIKKDVAGSFRRVFFHTQDRISLGFLPLP